MEKPTIFSGNSPSSNLQSSKSQFASQKRAKKIKLHFNKQHQTILLDSSHFHRPVALLKEEITFEMFFLQPALKWTYSLYFWLRDIVRNKARFLS